LIKQNRLSIFIPIMNVKGPEMSTLPCTEVSLASIGAAGTLDLNLQRQSMISLPDAAGLRVSCADGAVWITLDQSTDDVVLQSGGVFSTTEHRRAIVYALKPSRIAVGAPAAVKSTGRRWQPAFGRLTGMPLAFSAGHN
jgi:Protein of unknown function (DUF2917)